MKLTTLNFLNQLDPADFTPDLARMDDMIKSLRLAEPLPVNGTPQTIAIIPEIGGDYDFNHEYDAC